MKCVVISFSRGSSQTRERTQVSCIAHRFSSVQSLSCVWLCDPMDHSMPGPSVHGISQVRILEWVAISYSKGSSRPKDQTQFSFVSCIGRQILYHCDTRPCITTKGSDSILHNMRLESPQWFLPAVWPWANFLTSLSVYICMKGVMI